MSDPMRERLVNLRDDIRSTPMLHAADAAARERWGNELSAILAELLAAPEAEREAVRGSAVCTNCGEVAGIHPAYADFVGPFCPDCWERVCEYFAATPEVKVMTAPLRDRLASVVFKMRDTVRVADTYPVDAAVSCTVIADWITGWADALEAALRAAPEGDERPTMTVGEVRKLLNGVAAWDIYRAQPDVRAFVDDVLATITGHVANMAAARAVAPEVK